MGSKIPCGDIRTSDNDDGMTKRKETYVSTNDVINTHPFVIPITKNINNSSNNFLFIYFPFKSCYVNCWIRYLKLSTQVDPEI